MKKLSLFLILAIVSNFAIAQGVLPKTEKVIPEKINTIKIAKMTQMRGQEGHGGDPIVSDFRQRGRFITYFIEKFQDQLEGMVDLASFKKAVTYAPVYLTTDELKGTKNEVLTAKTVPDSDSPVGFSIYINESRWLSLFNPEEKHARVSPYNILRLVFHEFLLASKHEDQLYQISYQLKATEDRYQKCDSSLINNLNQDYNPVKVIRAEKNLASSFSPFFWESTICSAGTIIETCSSKDEKNSVAQRFNSFIKQEKNKFRKRINKQWYKNFLKATKDRVNRNLGLNSDYKLNNVVFKVQNLPLITQNLYANRDKLITELTEFIDLVVPGNREMYSAASLTGTIISPKRSPNLNLYISSVSQSSFNVGSMKSAVIQGQSVFAQSGHREFGYIYTNNEREQFQNAYRQALEHYMVKCEQERSNAINEVKSFYQFVYAEDCENSGQLVMKIELSDQYQRHGGTIITGSYIGARLYFKGTVSVYYLEESWD